MNKIRVGIIGIGSFGSRRAKLLREHPHAEIACVSSRTQENAKSKAQQLGCNFTTDYHEILRNPDVDAVTISTPNTLHHQIALKALTAGKHVSVEYPITQTVEEFDTLCRKAQERNLVLHHAVTPMIEPQALTMRSLIKKVGRVMVIRSSYVGGSGGRNWYLDPKFCGNFFGALSIHMIAYQKAVLGEDPDWVFGAYNSCGQGKGSLHTTSLLCQYPSGILAYNDWGMGFTKWLWQWSIEGENGRLVYEPNFPRGHGIRILTEEEDSFVEMESQSTVVAKDTDNFLAQIIDVAKPYASHECTRELLAICQAAQQSAQTGRRISL